MGTDVGSGIVADADLVAAFVAAFPDRSRKQLIRPLSVNTDVAIGKVGLRGVVGGGQVVSSVIQRVHEVGTIAHKPVNRDPEVFRQLRVLECEDDGELVRRRICLGAAREDDVDFQHAASLDYGPEADQRAHEWPKSTEDEMHDDNVVDVVVVDVVVDDVVVVVVDGVVDVVVDVVVVD